jgi:hypothetical protein
MFGGKMIRKNGFLILLVSWLMPMESTLAQISNTSALATLAQSMAPGTWATLPTAGLDAALYVRTCNILQYADELIWNSVTHEAYFHGAGHCTGNGPSGRFIKYSAAENAWTELPDFPQDGDGIDVHAYDHQAIDPTTQTYYKRLYFSPVVDSFDLQTGQWTHAALMIPTSLVQVAGGFEYFPDRESFVFVDGNWGTYEFSKVTGTWREISCGSVSGCGPSLLIMGNYSNIARYSSKSRSVIFGGGHGGGIESFELYRLDADGRVTPLKRTPRSIAISKSIFVEDPMTGHFIVPYDDKTFWDFDPIADQWVQLDARNVPIWNGMETPVFSRVAAAVPEYGVTMWVGFNYEGSKVHLYKHADGPLPPPYQDTVAPTVSIVSPMAGALVARFSP